VVHVVGRHDTDALDLLRSRGVTIRPVQPFDSRSPHCNKISGALSLAEEGVEGIAVSNRQRHRRLRRPAGPPCRPDAVAMKCVDGPNPPLANRRACVQRGRSRASAAGRPRLQPQIRGPSRAMQTGGFIFCAGNYSAQWQQLGVIGPTGCLKGLNTAGSLSEYVDQMAHGARIARRPDCHPTPTPSMEHADARSQVDFAQSWPTGSPPLPRGRADHRPRVAGRQQGNRRSHRRVQRCDLGTVARMLPAQLLLDWRYRSNPALGPGPGSRGAALVAKR